MNMQKLTTLPIQAPPAQFRKLLIVTATMLLITACASAPRVPEGSADVRSRLTVLRTNPELASRAPIEIQAAELAVVAAETPQQDVDMARHLVLIADQKVEIAGAWAQSRLYEDQRADLSARSEAMRLDARTREADRARQDANTARNQASSARSDTDFARQQAAIAQNAASTALAVADTARDQAAAARNDASAARSDANVARNDAGVARAETAELQRQITELNAQITDRGLVVTLGDVLFETGNAQLRGGTPNNLDKLAAFLNRFETRTVMIEGHTDSVGSDISNMSLSQRRADSVQAYLVSQGVARSRISSDGKGEGSPVADNESPTGRQQNRRVEVIISNQL
jgi:outer membrane protein OmpA-like peptidoglycan-associated protein